MLYLQTFLFKFQETLAFNLDIQQVNKLKAIFTCYTFECAFFRNRIAGNLGTVSEQNKDISNSYRIQDTGYRILDTGYRIQDTGYRIQDTGYSQQHSHSPS